MKNIFKLPNVFRFVCVTLFAVTVLFNCSEEKFKESTDETLNITEFLRANTERYSLFLQILDITDYASFMNTYGTYTLFLPTNEAVEAYMTDLGVSALENVPLEDLQELAKLHILEQKIETTTFTDGKIATPSMQGQFLITGAVNTSDGSSITVNKSAKISTSNIEVGNGIIHEIDQVLRVATKTIAETIESDPSLSLFTEAMKATGWYEVLDRPITYVDSVPSYLSVIAQSNAVFEEAGFNNLDDLKTRYSHLGDPMNPEDSLNLFVAYRISPGLNYLADLAVTPALITKAPLEVISIKLSADTLLINEETFAGIFEKGVEIDREASDETATNGVVHTVKENYFIKKRLPAPVYFDLADQPEFRQLSSVFRVPGMWAGLSDAELADVTWEGTPALNYVCQALGSSSRPGWHGDVLESVRFRDGFNNNIEFTTPVIIKGQYKVWISWRTNLRATNSVRAYFNDTPLARTFNMQEYVNTGEAERVLESQGYKRHISPTSGNYNCKLLGIINVETTGRHKFKLQSLAYAGGQSWFDVVEFRPVDMDQLYPKFEAGGDGLIYE
ncbi:fasciclin domain-containing protein [Aestuariibaculum suncheonense]|uniref:Fasciclin domain-containing protein n=1 Tax=Aestuariibaculum suncheonense TaxID=1028745 RepID=A0A8J6Q6B4_9FLAO|nr:fasciclin domain-containing protein [Aestuariibaculum suncheonense]MBD0834821.1 fasciclin domain-containing protein [Aestuariibaculum suncheonense]